ncbi:hypothetical protein [Mycobacterium intracellulare]|uniref:Intersectin-EH binding protein Ibp1 n=1 Tax=Mycobacterium intracellulare TaxID=1767 RepID=A0A7R7MS38_MYCIT|nr:hypothetical protein [Mycobacterium intracellulare]BCO97657.1 hypothetical protein MINTM018_04270 [Mycobacterium intracellulare]
MNRKLILAALVTGALGTVLAPVAQADPPCAAFDTCKYMPNPYNAGPLLPTWEVPGGYGLPGGSPVQCVPTGFSSNAVCSPGTLPGSGY